MKKLFIFLSFWVFVLSTLAAQAPKEKTLLWEISGNGITQPSYLFGTIHLMCPDDIKMPEIVSEKFNSSKYLFLEIDLTDPHMMENAVVMMQMKDSTTIEKLLGKDFEKVNQSFKSITGMPLQMMNQIKPMMIISALLPAMIGCMPASWESAFQKMAEEKKMAVKGLETVKDQMDVFDSIPYKNQANILSRTILNMDSSKQELQKMLKMYNEKDIEQMNRVTTMDTDLKNFEGALINDRNKKWIPVIEKQIKNESTFFAFGAGHLGGEMGVINLMRLKGYIIRPIMY